MQIQGARASKHQINRMVVSIQPAVKAEESMKSALKPVPEDNFDC